jgi:sec-independent protein translocase protein TatC
MPPYDEDPSLHTMSFGDHLEELRRRMLFGLAAPIPLFIVFFLFSNTLIEWLLLPTFRVLQERGLSADLQALSPPEILVTQLKLSLIAAIVASAPWLVYQAWLFIAPGLYRHERRFVYLLVPGSAVLTAAGVTLMYTAMLPLMLHVLIAFGQNVHVSADGPKRDPAVVAALERTESIPVLTRAPEPLEDGYVWLKAPEMKLYVGVDDGKAIVPREVRPINRGTIKQTYRVSFAINFTLVLLLGISIAFQMPLVILLMGWLGLASASWLRAQRKYALMVCAVVSAMITPADAVSMLMMLVPLYGLYELGILLLVLMPASKVAEGRLLRFDVRRPRGGRSTDKESADKRRNGPDQTSQPSQPDGTEPRGGGGGQAGSENTDGERDA